MPVNRSVILSLTLHLDFFPSNMIFFKSKSAAFSFYPVTIPFYSTVCHKIRINGFTVNTHTVSKEHVEMKHSVKLMDN